MVFLLCFIQFLLPAGDATFLKSEALAGDGVYSILRRYQLDGHSCNFEKFYEINSLQKNARLRQGNSYLIPVFQYDFDGKTIRSSIGINDYDTALGIQKYNELLHEIGVKSSSYKSDKILWVPFHALNCPETDIDVPTPVMELPESSGKGKRQFPIFGTKYAYTPLASEKLKGRVFFIVSGHGGPDPGAIGFIGKSRLCEDEYAYDVSLRLCRLLIAHGATAYMVNRDPNDGIRSQELLKCDIDEVLWGDVKISERHKPRLFQGSDIINELYQKHKLQGINKQLMVTIHVDSRAKGQGTDVFFYYYPDDEPGEKIAKKVHQTFETRYEAYQKGRKYTGTVTARDLHMLRETKVTSLYVELGNIRNSRDQQRLIKENNRQLLAQWLFEGIIQ